MTYRGALLASMALAAVSFAALPAVAEEELKIGVLATLSGPATAWGVSMQSAAELAAEDANAAGGLKIGGETYKVTVVSYDDKYKATDAVTAANRLIYEDEVDFIMGPMGSAPAVAVLPLTTDAKLITITMAFTPKALDAEFPYSFRPVLSTEEFSGPQIAWVVNKLGSKRIGGLFPNDESGQQVAEANAAAYEAVGAEFVSKEYFERDRVDFTPLLTRMLAENIDAIELDGNSPQTAGLIVKQSRELGFTGPIIRSGGDATAAIIDVAGIEAANNLYVHQAIDPDDEAIKAYEARFNAAYQGTMNAFSPYFYTNTMMVFAAMEAAGTTDSDAVLAELEKMSEYDSLLGKVSWTDEGKYGLPHQLEAPFYIAQITDGKATIVATCTFDGCE